jgi:hypothetical protein
MTATDPRAAALAEAIALRFHDPDDPCDLDSPDDLCMEDAAAILAALAKKGIVLSLPNGDVTVPYDEIVRLRRIEEAARDWRAALDEYSVRPWDKGAQRRYGDARAALRAALGDEA